MPAVIAGALLLVTFWPILRSMYGSWFDEPASMEHGILVVPAALCMVWSKRARLREIRREPSLWGVVLTGLGAAQAIVGTMAHGIWISRMAFLVSLVGLIAALYGMRMVRALAYPLCTLVLMVTPPTFLYERLTLDLQLLASRIGEATLDALGYPVLREGNVLELVGIKLSVEEACSGIRSLFSIWFLCVVYGYFFATGRIMRLLIVLSAVPVAILGNAGRIVVTGIASQYNRALVEGAAHQAFGYLSVAISAAGCIVFHLLTVLLRRAWRSRHA
ncbi:MAG TPA: exosortase/archaeosortase family protein [Bryobacteraceae bacterium]|nr:exosortase/archaeosortase family protein [Bryobacteraceae bacterium]